MSIFDQFKKQELKKEQMLAKKENPHLETSINKHLEQCIALLETEMQYNDLYHEAYEYTKDDNITKQLIDQFVVQSKSLENNPNFGDLGVYLSALIQHAYEAGENAFTIFAPWNTPLDCMGAYLKGTQSNPVKLTVHGSVGNFCLNDAHYVHALFTGEVNQWCGVDATNIRATFLDEVGGQCGMAMENSALTFYEKVGDDCGRFSKKSYFLFLNAHERCDSNSSDYMLVDPKKVITLARKCGTHWRWV